MSDDVELVWTVLCPDGHCRAFTYRDEASANREAIRRDSHGCLFMRRGPRLKGLPKEWWNPACPGVGKHLATPAVME